MDILKFLFLPWEMLSDRMILQQTDGAAEKVSFAVGVSGI